MQQSGLAGKHQLTHAVYLPECAEGLIVIDVSWTESSHHRSTGVPP